MTSDSKTTEGSEKIKSNSSIAEVAKLLDTTWQLEDYSKKRSTRKYIKLDKILGVKNDEVYIVDELFIYGDNFKGATGTSYRIVTHKEYDEQMEEDNLKEYFRDNWIDFIQNFDKTKHKSPGLGDLGLEEFIEFLQEEAENEESLLYYDEKIMEDDERYKEFIKLFDGQEIQKEIKFFYVQSGGRCFDDKLEGFRIVDETLAKAVKMMEATK